MDMEMITDLMEAVMILCFGLSWPISIRKSWVSRTAKGKSLFFECFIWIGYEFASDNEYIKYKNKKLKEKTLSFNISPPP